MATPKTVVDSSVDLDEAVLNLFLRAGKAQVKVNYFVLAFVAASNAVTVDSAWDSDGEIVDADLSWNAGSTQIDVTLSGFTAVPVAFATHHVTSTSSNVGHVIAEGLSTSTARVVFLDAAAGPSKVDPSHDIEVNVLFIGV